MLRAIARGGEGSEGNNRWFLTHSCIMHRRFFVCDRELYNCINILCFLSFPRISFVLYSKVKFAL
jgi:hypothetical protein